MGTLNSYATLAEFKDYWKNRGGQNSTDAADDGVIEMLLRAGSRYIDTQTQRQFVPYAETRYFDVPSGDDIDSRMLQLGDDLLEIIEVVNGDGVTIPSTQYYPYPRNKSPHYGIRLRDNSTFYWSTDGAGETHDVIAVTGLWGYHDRYQTAWLSGSTLSSSINATTATIPLTSASLFAAGNLIRIENELCHVSAKAMNNLTASRGENYSTATEHDSGTAVSIWQPMEEARNACLEIANTAYRRRFGQNTSNAATVTAAGIVLTPRDIPQLAMDFIRAYRRYL